MNWPHVLNVMLVEASDGNAYIIACDRAWAWSKCVPLRAGDTFNARRTSKGWPWSPLTKREKGQNPRIAFCNLRSFGELRITAAKML